MIQTITYDDTMYQLVPKDPTQAMCQEGQWKAKEWPKFPLRISPIYKAMLSASPTPPAQPVKPLTDKQLDNIWIQRDCIEAIQNGDILAQFRAAARSAIEAANGIKK